MTRGLRAALADLRERGGADALAGFALLAIGALALLVALAVALLG